MRSMPFAFASGALAALLLLSPMDASAQFGRTFRSMTKLSDTDIALMRKIVREDFTGKPNGTTASWSNPESSNSGTLTLLNSFTSKGRDCRRVKYVVRPGPKQPAGTVPATYELTSCRNADGSWNLDKTARPDKG